MELVVTSSVNQIFSSPNPLPSCGDLKQARVMPGTGRSPRKEKIPAAVRSGAVTRSSYLTRWHAPGCLCSNAVIVETVASQ